MTYAYRLKRWTVALAAGGSIAALGCQLALAAPAIIDNGTVQLGINADGTLVTPSQIGLTYLPSGGEALAPGCDCEGWGIIDLSNTANKFGVSPPGGNSTVNAGNGTATITVSGTGTNGASTGNAAVSTVDIVMGGNPWAQVKQDFHPTPATQYLYEDSVTIKNTGTSAIGNLGFRRAMDWDVPPTAFNEYVTIQGWPAANLIHSSDDGFHSLDMTDSLVGSAIATNTEDRNFTNSGPDDHGAAFDFQFGSLAPGASKNFKIFYGAAGDPATALHALQSVGAEVYSLGMPSNFAPTDPQFGTPNTFIFGFAGVGGTALGQVQVISLGLIRQYSNAAARHHNDAIGMRMDGLTGGGDRLNDGKDADALGFKVFGMAAMVNGNFIPVQGTKSNFTLDHFDAGVDYTFDPMIPDVQNIRVGGAVGTVTGEAGSPVGASTTLYGRIEVQDNISASLYGSVRFLDRGYFETAVSWGSYNYDVFRTQSTALFIGKTNDQQYDWLARAGYDFPLEDLDLGLPGGSSLSAGPFAQVEYIAGRIGEFTETSTAAPGNVLTFPHAPYVGWTTQLGGRLNYAEEIDGNGYGITVKGAWEHQFSDRIVDPVTTGGLPSLAPYGLKTQDRARVGVRIFTTLLNDQLTLAVEDEAAFGSGGHENAVGIQGRYRFY
jgi:hypothetical protein